jgi:DNA mismatch endonuclease (patch repair protein)
MKKPDEVRSRTMRAVKSKDTKPEWLVRRLLHAAGFRYRLHGKDLPGKPDLVFPSRRKVVFVHGCFWHGHDCARGDRQPKINADYWIAKIARNKARDVEHLAALCAAGWKTHVVWECEIKNPGLLARLKRFLGNGRA